MQTPRPMTHDLLKNVLFGLNVQVQKVVVNDLREDTFYAVISVERDGDGFRVRGRRIERLVAQTDFENEESAERFQRDLERMGIARELRRAGVQPGDSVAIGTRELEWGDEGWA